MDTLRNEKRKEEVEYKEPTKYISAHFIPAIVSRVANKLHKSRCCDSKCHLCLC